MVGVRDPGTIEDQEYQRRVDRLMMVYENSRRRRFIGTDTAIAVALGASFAISWHFVPWVSMVCDWLSY